MVRLGSGPGHLLLHEQGSEISFEGAACVRDSAERGNPEEMNPIESAIRKFILENFLFTSDPASISGDTSFLEKGIVDSTGILEIVNFLEESFHFKVEDDEVVPDNFDCIDKLVRYVERKKAPAAKIV